MPFFFSGSRSDQFDYSEDIDNPLPPCPDSPNCVRLTKKHDAGEKATWNSIKSVLEEMSPEEINASEHTKRIVSVFRVSVYYDDLVIQLETTEEQQTLVHMRSYSRTGYTDFGVNRRRVKRFLRLLKSELS